MRGMILGLVALLVACTPNQGAPEAPTLTLANLDGTYYPAGGFLAPGDSIRLTITASSARATGYLFTVTTIDPGWSGLPTGVATTVGSLAFTAVHLTAWDSVRLVGCAIGTQGTKQSPQTCSTVTFKRGPGTPTVGWDSSLTITQVLVKPDSVRLTFGQVQQFCPYFRALDGKVRIASGYETLPTCQAEYDKLPAGDRLPGYPVAMTRSTQVVPIHGDWRVAIRTPQRELAHLLFAGPFQEAV